MLHPLDWGIRRCFEQFYRKHIALNAVCLMDLWKDIKLKMNILQAVHFTAIAWQQILSVRLCT